MIVFNVCMQHPGYTPAGASPGPTPPLRSGTFISTGHESHPFPSTLKSQILSNQFLSVEWVMRQYLMADLISISLITGKV